MTAIETNKDVLRIELIDSFHVRWPSVLSQIDRDGGRGRLRVERDDWLRARQCLLVAFRGDEDVIGYAVFHLAPGIKRLEDKRPAVEAHLDDLAVRTGLGQADVRQLLLEAAREHALSLNVRKLVDFA
jgi:hypothetical protein